MDNHDRTMLCLALDTAILEVTKDVAKTPADHPEYTGYIFTLGEFNRLYREMNDDLHQLRSTEGQHQQSGADDSNP